jgi:leucyl-tRNA synthetase
MVLNAWTRLMAPFTPHVCEELWAAGLGEGYVSLAPWPKADASMVDEQAEQAEELLEKTQRDVEEILSLTKAQARRIILYTTPEWKRALLAKAAELASHGNGKLDMSALMKSAMSDPLISGYKKDAPKYAQKLAKAAHSLNEGDLKLDEFETLSREKEYLRSVLGVPVEVYSADEPGADPMGKSRQAEPGRPAIYIE